jgi:hypothetical protein
MSVTATIPMMTPSAVRVERVLFERICATAIFQLSLSSYKKRFISKPQHRRQGIFHRQVLDATNPPSSLSISPSRKRTVRRA